MDPQAMQLTGTFVVEVGLRQAWPFVTFCDNGPTPPVETRLYVDSTFTVAPGPHDLSALDTLDQINNLTVDAARVLDDGSLTIGFEGGLRLTVSGRATSSTVGEPWWLGRQH